MSITAEGFALAPRILLAVTASSRSFSVAAALAAASCAAAASSVMLSSCCAARTARMPEWLSGTTPSKSRCKRVMSSADPACMHHVQPHSTCEKRFLCIDKHTPQPLESTSQQLQVYRSTLWGTQLPLMPPRASLKSNQHLRRAWPPAPAPETRRSATPTGSGSHCALPRTPGRRRR